jgi:hypothetical protein
MNLTDKKKSKKKTGQPRAKNGSPKPSPGANIHKAKAITTSKASRGFTTKKPPKASLSYPL